MKQEKQSRRAPDPLTFRVVTTKPISEGINSDKGNALAIAIVEASDEKVEVVRAGDGFILKSKGGEAYLQDAFGENEHGLKVLGCRISVESLRLKWFRDSLRAIVGFRNDEEMYEGLVKERFFTVPWSSEYYISLNGLSILDEKNSKELWGLRKKLDIAIDYLEAYATAAFSKKLPEGFSIIPALGYSLYAKDAKAFKSMIEEDGTFKKAVASANQAASELSEETGMNVEAMRKKITRWNWAGGMEL